MSKQLHRSNQQHHLLYSHSKESTNITISVEYEANVLGSEMGYKCRLKYIHQHDVNKVILAHINITSM